MKHSVDSGTKIVQITLWTPFLENLIEGDHQGSNAIRLVRSDSGTPTAVVKVAKDPKQLCPYNASEVAERLKKQTGNEQWGSNHVAVVAEFLKVKNSDNEYHYGYRTGSNTLHSYSDAFITRVCERLKSDPELIKKAYRARNNRR